MIEIQYCPRCVGEGRKTKPPFDPTNLDSITKPIEWREDKECYICNGIGYLNLDFTTLQL